MEAKETILSISSENHIWRWTSILLLIGLLASIALAHRMIHKQPTVWLLTEDGRFLDGNGKFFSWEVREAAQRAIETFYVPSPERDERLDLYFSMSLAKAGRKFRARDRFVTFKIDKVEQKGNQISLMGTLFRENEKEVHLNLIMERINRSKENPFGLVVSSSTRTG